MTETIKVHLAYTVLFGMAVGATGMCILTGYLGLALLFLLTSFAIVIFRFRAKKRLQVSDVQSAQRAVRRSGYGVLAEGQDAMRQHLQKHPGDYKVALTLARALSKYNLTPEGRSAYELAARGAIQKDMKLAVEIFKEYFSRYTKPLSARLTYDLALLAEKYGDSHFATQGLESVFNANGCEPEMARRALRECIRICTDLCLDDAVKAYKERLHSLNHPS